MRGTKIRAARSQGMPPELRRFWIWVVALASLSLLYTLVMTFVLHKPYPYGLPMFHADFPFWDFTVFQTRFEQFGTQAFWDTFNYPFTYPAATGVIFAALYRSQHALGIYLALCAIALAVGVTLLIGALIRKGTLPGFAILLSLTLLVTCWPVGYLLNRANIEGIVAMVTAAAILSLWYEWWWLGASLIGVAGALKLFPLILLGLLLSRRRYKEFAGGLGVMIFVTLGSLHLLGPSIGEAELHVLKGMEFFDHHWAAAMLPGEIGFDHSLFTLIKVPLALGYWLTHPMVAKNANSGPEWLSEALGPLLDLALKVYAAMAALLGTALYFIRIRKLPMLNQMLALSVCMVLFPPVSFDYTLVHLLAPTGLLCVYVSTQWRRGRFMQEARPVFICLAIVMTMNAYFTLVVRWAGQVRAVALLLLLYQILQIRLECEETEAVTAGGREL